MRIGTAWRSGVLAVALVIGLPLTATAAQDSANASDGSAPKKGGPELKIIDDLYDFGVLRQGEVKRVTHTFRFKNIGTEDLVITKVKPSCGCTSAIPSATTIAPGNEATLTAALRPKGKFGQQSVTVRIETNDADHPQHTFRIVGAIVSPWRVVPSILDLREVGKGESKQRMANVLTQMFPGDPLHRITAVRSDNAAVEVATKEFFVPQKPRKGKTYLEFQRPILVRVSAGKKLGPHNATVYISTDDPESPTLTLRVRWTVEGDLAVSAKRVISTRMKGRSTKRPLTISSRSGTPFEVLSIEVKDKNGGEGVLELVPSGENTPTKKTYRVQVKEDTPAQKRPYLGDILFSLNHPEQKRIRIPYTASVRD